MIHYHFKILIIPNFKSGTHEGKFFFLLGGISAHNYNNYYKNVCMQVFSIILAAATLQSCTSNLFSYFFV